jgi:hypothetical protein
MNTKHMSKRGAPKRHLRPANPTAPAAPPAPDKSNTGNRADKVALAASKLIIDDLPDAERAFLATCQQICRADKGCCTPFEEFFGHIVSAVEWGMWPTPDRIRDFLKEFEENYEDMTQDVASFLSHYPPTTPAADALQE